MIITFLIALVSTSIAQNWDEPTYIEGEKYKGFIILNDGDTLYGLLKAQYPSDLNTQNHVTIMVSNQTSCIFYDEKEKTSKRYKAKELKGYMIAERYYTSLDYNDNLMAKSKTFALLLKQGGISEYVYYSSKPDLLHKKTSNESYTDYYNKIYSKKTVYHRDGVKPIDNQSIALGFKKKMSAFVEDNQKLASKIANKEKGYKMFNLQKIINEYNDWHLTK